MTLMSPTHYLPSEEVKYSNYPELYEVMDKIRAFQAMLEPIMLATYEYDEGMADAIYVNAAEVERVLSLSYEITDFLGIAPNVCYEFVLPIREAQESLHELLFSFKYERAPIVLDRQRTEMRRLGNISHNNREGVR